MFLLLSTLIAAAEPPTPPAPAGMQPAPWIDLAGQRAAVHVEQDPPQLELGIVAKSRLPVAVSEVTVGVLFAEDPEALAAADAGRLYREDLGRGGEVAAIRHTTAVEMAAGESAPIPWQVAVQPEWPVPRAFATHLLGYRLAEPQLPLLFELLETEQAADEWAAMAAFALLDGATAKQSVRDRFGAAKALRDGLIAEFAAPLPEKISHEIAARRIYAALALGVLGGPEARSALEKAKERGELTRLDEALQVVMVARIISSRWETPLAFGISPRVRTMKDLVDYALTSIETWEETPDEQPVSGGEASPRPEVSPPEDPQLVAGGAGVRLVVLVGAVLLAAGLWWWLRRRR